MMQNNIIIVAGTRPNFVKVSSIIRELNKINIKYTLVNTGQHYDSNMSDLFFIKQPDISLKIGSGSQILQTARIMEKFEKICLTYKPSLVIVVGDVTSTIAASLVVCKMPDIKLAHVEAGCRSFDKTMPEETNRIITDVLSDYLFVVEPDHMNNLIREGVDKNKIFLVGDNIIDNLLYTKQKLGAVKKIDGRILVTVHRQNNTDNLTRLVEILRAIDSLCRKFDVKFVMHPRTKQKIDEHNLKNLLEHIDVMSPLGYSDFVREMSMASVVLTDSGGVTIEAAVLGVPCVVLRKELERNFLVKEGLSILVDNDYDRIIKETETAIKNGPVSLNSIWSNLLDGKASSRIIKILLEKENNINE